MERTTIDENESETKYVQEVLAMMRGLHHIEIDHTPCMV